MLQQTRVETVISYFERWMSKFPTISALAAASSDEVQQAWAGLGYYRRAKFLLEGAKFVLAEFNGTLPSELSDLKRIPGIGDYTAGAIASIAFHQRAPVVDGNVIRVFSRLRAIAAAPNDSRALKLHWSLAAEVVDEQRPGDFNQALMELGATLCTRSNPDCDACPVRSLCRAYGEDDGPDLADIEDGCGICSPDNDDVRDRGVTRFPLTKVRAKSRLETTKVCCIESELGFLLIKRHDKGLLAGQWEFPCWERHEDLLRRILLLSANAPVAAGSLTHIFSHIRMTIAVEYVFVADIPKHHLRSRKVRFVPRASFAESPLTTGVQKVFRKIQALW